MLWCKICSLKVLRQRSQLHVTLCNNVSKLIRSNVGKQNLTMISQCQQQVGIWSLPYSQTSAPHQYYHASLSCFNKHYRLELKNRSMSYFFSL